MEFLTKKMIDDALEEIKKKWRIFIDENNKNNSLLISENEVTKALERCVNDRADCSECPYLGTEIKEGITCEVKMINNALAVIYNLQAENKKLQALLKALDIKIETAEDNKKNTPITDEDIRKALDCCITKDCDKCPFTVFLCDDRYALIWAQDLIKRQDAELERFKRELNADVYELQVGRSNGKTQKVQKVLLLRAKAIKAEAMKEFADKLQDRCLEQGGCIYASDIGAVLNEMEGENNA